MLIIKGTLSQDCSLQLLQVWLKMMEK